MSHIRTDVARISNPNEALLREVVNKFAGTEPGAVVGTVATSYYDKPIRSNISLALKAAAFPRGFAIGTVDPEDKTRKGVFYTGDDYRVEADYRRATQTIDQLYFASAMKQALRDSQYAVTSESFEGGEVVIHSMSNGGEPAQVTVRVTPEGKYKWDFNGFKGDECFKVQSVIEGALKRQGIVVQNESVTKKDDESWLEETQALPQAQSEREN